MNRGLLSGVKGLLVPEQYGGGDPANDGSALAADSTQPGGFRWVAGVAGPLPPVLGWIGMGGNFSSSNVAMFNNSLIAFSPLLLAGTASFDQIGLRVQTAGTTGTLIRLGVYSSGPDGAPLTRLIDAGTVTGDSTGTKAITIPALTLTAGLCWVAVVQQAVFTTAPSIDQGNSVVLHLAQSGSQTSLTTANSGSYVSAVQWTGALPASMSGQLSVTGNTLTGPLFQMHRSA